MALARRIDEEGHKRGRARQPHESVVTYSAILSTSVLPDERLARVGELVSQALFGPGRPSSEDRLWAESTFATVLDEHPVDRRPTLTPSF